MRLAARTSHYTAGWEAIYPNLTSGSAFARIRRLQYEGWSISSRDAYFLSSTKNHSTVQ